MTENPKLGPHELESVCAGNLLLKRKWRVFPPLSHGCFCR